MRDDFPLSVSSDHNRDVTSSDRSFHIQVGEKVVSLQRIVLIAALSLACWAPLAYTIEVIKFS